MAVLTKSEFLAALSDHLGNDSTPEALALLENMTDTYNSLEKQALAGDGGWKQKYEENDAAWRTRYAARFFSGGENNANSPNPSVVDRSETVTIGDLFK